VLFNIEVLYYLTYGTLAFIATFVHPFFFAFHLTEIVIRFPQLRNIIKSFWEPKISLLLTFILIILFNYFFTLIAYVYFYDDYDNKCDSLLYCFLETFDKAFKNNGGIGGWLN
jgi:inositol 1,4,5-triphosphate receptor type 1/inositol 1,4,5-triphosphate receptor type 3